MTDRYESCQTRVVFNGPTPADLLLHLERIGPADHPSLLQFPDPSSSPTWILGAAPVSTLRIQEEQGLWTQAGVTSLWRGSPFPLMRSALATVSWEPGSDPLPSDFFGGWIVALSYELAHSVELLPRTVRRDHSFPDLWMGFYPSVYTSSESSPGWQIHTLKIAGESMPEVEARLDRMEKILTQAGKREALSSPSIFLSASSLVRQFSPEEYQAAVARAIEYIHAGDLFQVNLSQRFDLPPVASPAELMGRLLAHNPAPYSAYLDLNGQAILSSSPELFLRVRNRNVETRPIKGTRPRGATPTEDAAFRHELESSEKDRAELTMITDLLRNDLGRVCRYGSVKVIAPRLLETYTTVFHTESVICGELREDTDLVALLMACWPGGSITGAPKVRAMEIIDELEPTARAFYTGSLGTIGVEGSLTLNLLIRTLLHDGERLSFQVGGGIVADSTPEGEYDETLHKAEGILRALYLPRLH